MHKVTVEYKTDDISYKCTFESSKEDLDIYDFTNHLIYPVYKSLGYSDKSIDDVLNA